MGNRRGGKAPRETGARGLEGRRTAAAAAAAAAKRFSTAESAQPCFSRARRVLLFVKLQRVCWLPAALGRHVWGWVCFLFLPLFFFLNGQLHAREKKIFRGDQSTGFRPLEWASILARESREGLTPLGWPEGLGARGSNRRCCLQLNPGECARLAYRDRVPESHSPACVPVCCRLAIPVLRSPPNKL